MSHESKAAAIKAIMNNPKLAKMIDEAFSSPLGSTKRARVKDIVSTINKITDKKYPAQNDGKGGDPMMPRTTSVSSPVEKSSFSNVKIFPPAPKMRSQEYNQGPKIDGVGGSYDGKGGDGNQYPSFQTASTISQAPSAFEQWMNPGSLTNNYIPEKGWMGRGLHAFDDAQTWAGNKLQKGAEIYGDIAKATGYGLAGATQAAATSAFSDNGTPYGETWGAKKQVDIYNKYFPNVTATVAANKQPQAPASQTDRLKDNKNGTYTWINNDGTKHTGKWGDNYQDKTVAKKSTTTSSINQSVAIPNASEIYKYNVTGKSADGKTLMGTLKPQFQKDFIGPKEGGSGYTDSGTTTTTEKTTTDTGAKKTDTTPSDRYSDVLKAVQSNIGAATFANTTIGNEALMKKLGYPFHGTEQENNQENEIALRKKLGIDEKLDNLNKLKDQGLDLEKDLIGYIQGKDEYIKGVNAMIDQNSTRLGEETDPFKRARLKQDQEYLYTLKGRQNKRYADFVAADIDSYNKQLTRAQTDYDKIKEEFERQRAAGEKQTATSYAATYNALVDLYNQFDGIELKQYQVDVAREASWKAMAENNKLGPDAYITARGIGMSGSSADNKSYIEEMPKYADTIIDSSAEKKGQFKDPNFDISNEVAKLVNENYDGRGVLEVIKNGILADRPNMSGGNTINRINELKANIGAFDKNVRDGKMGDLDAMGLKNSLVAVAGPAIEARLGQITNLKSILSDLTGEGWGSPYGKSDSEKQRFVNKYNSTIKDSKLLEAIFDGYRTLINQPGAVWEMAFGDKVSNLGDRLIPVVSDVLLKTILSSNEGYFQTPKP